MAAHEPVGEETPFTIPAEYAQQQLNDKLGLTLVEYGPDRVVGTMPVHGNLQPYGLLHGGANAVLIEALGSTVAILNAGLDKITVGVDLSCTHHRAVRSGIVIGVATPIHIGRTIITVEVVVTDENDRRVCTGRLSCVVRR